MADKELAGYGSAGGGQKEAYQQFSNTDKSAHKRTNEPMNKILPNDCNSISSSNGSSSGGGYYPSLNIAQKGKLILPTALWILLIIGGICFLTLMVSLNKTMINLEKIVDLEEEKVGLLGAIKALEHLKASKNDEKDCDDGPVRSSFFGRGAPKNKPKLHKHVSSLPVDDDLPIVDELLIIGEDEPLSKGIGAKHSNDMLFKLLPDSLLGADIGLPQRRRHNNLHSLKSSSSSGGVIVTSMTGPDGENSVVEQRFGDAMPSSGAVDNGIPELINSMMDAISKDPLIRGKPKPLVSVDFDSKLAGKPPVEDMELIAASSSEKQKADGHRRRPSNGHNNQVDLLMPLGDLVEQQPPSLANLLMQPMMSLDFPPSAMDLNNGPAGLPLLIDRPPGALESPVHHHHGHSHDHKHHRLPKHQVHHHHHQSMGASPFESLGALGNLPPFIISLEGTNNKNPNVNLLKDESAPALIGGHFGRPQIVQGNTHLPSTIGQSPYELLMQPASATGSPSDEELILSSLIQSFGKGNTNTGQHKSPPSGNGQPWNMLADDLSGAFIQTIFNSPPASIAANGGMATMLVDGSSPSPAIIMSKPISGVAILDGPPKSSPVVESGKKSVGETNKSASELAKGMLDSVLELDKLIVAPEQLQASKSPFHVQQSSSSSPVPPPMGTLEDLNKAKAALNDVEQLISKTQASKASEDAINRLIPAQSNIESAASETMKQNDDFLSTTPPTLGSATTLRVSDLDDEFGKEFGSLMNNIFTLPQSGGQTESMRSEGAGASTKSSSSQDTSTTNEINPLSNIDQFDNLKLENDNESFDAHDG